MTANGATQYEWVGESLTNTKRTVTPNETTQYTVYGTDDNGCHGTSEPYTIKVNTAPEFTVEATSDYVCEGSYDTLFVKYDKTVDGHATSFTWTNTGELKDSIYPAIYETANYMVIGRNDYGCETTRMKLITKKDYPTLSFESTNDIICEGTDVTITAISNATDYKWQDGTVGNEYTIENISAGKTLTAYATLDGCTTTDQFVVNVNPKPYVWITGSRDTCTYSEIILTAKGASTYKWSNGKSGENITLFYKNEPGTYQYSVVGTDINGCTYETEPYEVTVHGAPKINITGSAEVCNGTSAQLTATGANTYVWTAGYNSNDATIYPTITKRTYFNVTGKDIYGCEGSANKWVNVIEYPTLAYEAPAQVCKGEPAKFTITGASKYFFNGDTIEGKTFTYTDVPENTTTYTVVGDKSGCQSSIRFMVDVLQHPTVWISGTNTICKESSTLLTAAGALTYVWTSDKTGKATISTAESYNAHPTEMTTYTVVGTDANKCSSTQTYTVNVDSLPKFEIEGPTQACEGNTITLAIKNGDAINYSWSNGASGETVTPIINKSTVFTVEATGSNNCTAKKTHTVRSYAYPTLSYSAPAQACAKTPVQIIVTGADSYNWTNDPKNHTGRMTDYPEGTTVYNVEGVSNNCATNLAISVDVLQNPTVSYQGNTSICRGTKMELVAYGAKEYQWST